MAQKQNQDLERNAACLPVATGHLRPAMGDDDPKGPQRNDDEGDGGSDGGAGGGNATLLEPKTRVKKPSMYRVLLLNDDYTPMEFVVRVLMSIFKKSQAEAEKIMLHVHQHGAGQCGVYTYEVAESKVHRVLDYARKNNHPLQCTMEAE